MECRSLLPLFARAAPLALLRVTLQGFRESKYREEIDMRKTALISVGLLALLLLAFPARSLAQISVGISVRVGPPALPVYEQPVCPDPGYIWVPGYWAYSDDGYYWVPGTWVLPPQPGLLWTPGYWGWGNDAYAWHAGYWGPQVGFYGGINYGYGYFGAGYVGGRWDHDRFVYNTAVTRVNTTVIHNTYVDRRVIVNNRTENRVSYNGGRGGISARPNSAQLAAERERHVQRTSLQTQQEQAASRNTALRASENHGRPPIAATAKPGDFRSNVVPAREAIRPSANGGNANRAATRPVQPNNRNEARPSNVNPNPPRNRNVTPPENRNVNPPNNTNRNRPENRNVTPPNNMNRNRPNTENQPHNQPHNNVEQNRSVRPEAPRPQPQHEQRGAPQPRPQPERKAEPQQKKPESDHQH